MSFPSRAVANNQRDFGKELTAIVSSERSDETRCSQVERLFNEVRDAHQLDLYFYSRFIDTWGKLGDLTKVLSLWEEMKQNNFNPTIKTYGVMLKVCCQLNRADLVEKYFAEMEAKKVTTDFKIYTSLVAALAPGNPERALSFARDIHKLPSTHEERTLLRNILHSIISEQKSPDRAARILHILNELGGQSFDDQIIQAHNQIINRAARSKQLHIALEVYRLAEANHVAPTVITYNSMLKAFVQADKFEEGVTFIQENMKLPRDNWTCNLIIKGHAKRGQIPAVYAEIEKMVALGINPTDRTCNSLLYAYVQAGKIEEGRQVFAKETAKWKLTADKVTLDILVKGYKHDVAKIDALFDELQITPKRKTVELIIEIARSCGRQDLVAKYTEILPKCE